MFNDIYIMVTPHEKIKEDQKIKRPHEIPSPLWKHNLSTDDA